MTGVEDPAGQGDGGVHIDTNYGPAAGTMTGPVTVTYGPVTINNAIATPPKAERTLPTDVPGFVGRQDELERLLAAVTDADGGPPRAVAIHAVDGMAGVGKTAFAVHAAHRLAARFPDGQLFVALRAHAPGQVPVQPDAALETLLQADGVAAAQIPAGLDARAGLWRDRMADRRLLLVLDDAADAGHVAPLLPGTPGCLVLITSRRKLTTLPGAAVLSLDALPPDQAARLFIQRAGGRGHDDPAAVERIIGLCGYLPLAITLTAARLHTHPTWTVADLAGDLAETRDRLSELASGELAVAGAFDLSYRDLTTVRQRLFRRLALHLGPDLDAYAAAALDDSSLAAARRGLEDLLEHNLLTEPHRGRYRFHDLIAEHARDLAAADVAAERDAALDRLVGYYLHTATAAAGNPAVSAPAEAPALTDPRLAADWLTREQSNLVAVAGWAAAHHRTPAAVGIPAALRNHLHLQGPWTLACDLHSTALAAARHAGDRPAQAQALIDLADSQRLTGDYPAAAGTAGQAVDLHRQLGNPRGEANALRGLAAVQVQTSDYVTAAGTAGQALDLHEQLGDRRGQAAALNTLGQVQYLSGDYPAATTSAERALDLHEQLGDRLGQANALVTLSRLQYITDDYAAAAVTGRQALDLHEQLGNRLGQANALGTLSRVHFQTGDYVPAAAVSEQALDLHRQLGDRIGQASDLEIIGRVQYQTGNYAAATTTAERTLDLYRQVGNPIGQANALHTLATVQHLSGDYAAAAGTIGQSLEIYRRQGNRLGQAAALDTLGTVQRLTGDYAAAVTTAGQAVELTRQLGDRYGEANALTALGRVLFLSGDHAAAGTAAEQAAGITEQLGDRHGQANALQTLGRVRQAAADHAAAATILGQALDLFREVGDTDGEAETLNHVGELLLVSSTAPAARRQFAAALGLARDIGAPAREARALEGIGDCALREGRRDEAITYLREALTIYRRIGAPDATRVEAVLEAP